MTNAIEAAVQRDPYFAVVTSPELGPLVWAAIHTLARTVTSKQRGAAFKQWLIDLAPVMPCSVCAAHWAEIAPTFDASTPAEAVKWTIDVHNSVNERLGKPVLSYAQALKAILAKTNPLLDKPRKSKSTPGITSSCSESEKQTGISGLDIGLIAVAVVFLIAFLIVLGLFLKRRKHPQ